MSRLSREIAQAAVSPVEVDNEGGLSRVFRFSEDFLGFDGHFPGYPILPAVAQVLAAQLLAETSLQADMRLQAVENAKFLLQIRPAEDVTVRCRLRPRGENVQVDAKVHGEQGVAASFTLQFSPARPE